MEFTSDENDRPLFDIDPAADQQDTYRDSGEYGGILPDQVAESVLDPNSQTSDTADAAPDIHLEDQEYTALNLDEQRLRQVASGIREQGITREQLIDIANRRLTAANPLLSHIVASIMNNVERNGGDSRSFTRGATLGLYLIDEASEGDAPVVGIASAQLAIQYRNQLPTLEDLRMAADRLLASQEALSRAFDEALAGMPEGTERNMARFGAGITALGVMAAEQFGGSGAEVWFEPDQR